METLTLTDEIRTKDKMSNESSIRKPEHLPPRRWMDSVHEGLSLLVAIGAWIELQFRRGVFEGTYSVWRFLPKTSPLLFLNPLALKPFMWTPL